MTEREDVAALVASRLRDVPDFPRPGILFKDITPLLADGAAMARVTRFVAGEWGDRVDVVAGIESRGFIFGAALAHELECGFVPVRKAGKLPADTISLGYDLEYGTATIEVHADALLPGQRVLVVDDVLATGGTAEAACRLVEQAGGVVTAFVAVIELDGLGGRQRMDGHVLDALVTL
jgi:adenine phosphoribosyltransferase